MKFLKQNYEWKDICILIDGVKLKFEDFNLRNFTLLSEVNTHSQLEFSLLVKDNIRKFEALVAKEKQKVEFLLDKDEKEILFFSGIAKETSIIYAGNGGILFNLKALSKTWVLDKVSKFTAFQDPAISYKEIIESIVKRYKNIKIIYDEEKFEKEIGAPIIQYDETDWEFLIRVTSQLGLGVSPLENGGVLLGYLKTNTKVKQCELKRSHLEIGKNSYGETLYKISCNQSYALANIIRVELGDERIAEVPVVKGILECIGGKLKGEYKLNHKNYKLPYIPNNKISGKVIEGKVEKVGVNNEIATMKINLTHGLAKIALSMQNSNGRYKERKAQGEYKGRWDIPYVTPYSQTNTGFFCTPEIGDIVSLYFPSNEEKLLYVSGAINNPGNGRFSDPEVRNYTLPITGERPYYEFKLDSDKITQYAKEKISNKTSNLMEMVSENILTASSVNEFKMSSAEQMSVDAREYSEKFEKASGIVLEEKLETIENYQANYLETLKTNAKNQYHTVTDTYYSKAINIEKIT